MYFKHRAWIPIAWLLSLGNVVSVWFAALPGEPWHATAHGALAAERLMARRRTPPRGEGVAISDDRLVRLENAVDAIAVEMERVGEGQRFLTKLLGEPARELERPGSSRSDPLRARLTRASEDE